MKHHIKGIKYISDPELYLIYRLAHQLQKCICRFNPRLKLYANELLSIFCKHRRHRSAQFFLFSIFSFPFPGELKLLSRMGKHIGCKIPVGMDGTAIDMGNHISW